MFSRILVATDLSEVSDCAIGSLAALRAWGVKETILVHCLDLCEPSMVKEELKALALPYLQRQAEALTKQGFETRIELSSGISHVEINRIAAEQNCSMLVIGSQGENLSSQIFVGGMASKVMHHAQKPVLIVRRRLRQGKDRAVCETCRMDPYGAILFPTDFSSNAEHAFTHLKKIVAVGSKEVTLLHVQEQTPAGKIALEESDRNDGARLEKMKRGLEAAGAVRVNVDLTSGAPAGVILSRLRDTDFSWVIMGKKDSGETSELMRNSVSYNVARHSPCPVLFIPAKQ